MSNAVAHWRTPSGQYRNAASADKTVLVSVKARLGPFGVAVVDLVPQLGGGLAQQLDKARARR